jgi:hypothetical protein
MLGGCKSIIPRPRYQVKAPPFLSLSMQLLCSLGIWIRNAEVWPEHGLFF